MAVVGRGLSWEVAGVLEFQCQVEARPRWWQPGCPGALLGPESWVTRDAPAMGSQGGDPPGPEKADTGAKDRLAAVHCSPLAPQPQTLPGP